MNTMHHILLQLYYQEPATEYCQYCNFCAFWQVNSQHNARTFDAGKATKENNQWQMYTEQIPTSRDANVSAKGPLELLNMTKDTTDYLWYTTR